jgi:hypothetical protein
MRFPAVTLALAITVLAFPAAAQRSKLQQARTTGELAELCSATPKDPLGDAKINYCYGYFQGAIQAEIRGGEARKAFCFPSTPVNRTGTIEEFVSWVRAGSDRKSPPAVEGLFQFLGERFPCKQ